MSGREAAKRVLLSLKPSSSRRLHSTSKLSIASGAKLVRGAITIGSNSSVVVEAGAVIDCDITIGENCEVLFGKDSSVVNTSFVVLNGAKVKLEDGAIIDSPTSPNSSIMVDNGTLLLGRRAHLMSTEVLVRFGGTLRIGQHTGVAYGSEIRCEEQVDIGSYGMISYRVCIYDTNTHSTDWRERRQRIEQCYPGGVAEAARPETSPVFIGDDVWIGKEATITKGARIGNRCIIGIRAVLGKDVIEDDSVVVAGKIRVIHREGSKLAFKPNVND
jgi:acetyltransferase-like isoleucine patch superfamily enzyme